MKTKPAKPVVLPTAVRTRADREANAFLESYNPLRGLTIRRAQMIFDATRRGNDVRLQWIYENIEQSDPTLMICAERRASALVDLDWTIRPKAAARARGFDQTLADEQAAFLEQAYGQAEETTLFPAIERLASAFFRGHAHVRPLWSDDGLGLAGFELLNAWNLCRDLVTGLWHWNPSAAETLDFGSLDPVPEGEIVTLVRTRHIDYPAMPIFLRNALGEKAWGRFLERYGIPPVIITMPPDMDPARVSEYCAAATQVADGGSGALPAGSLVSYAHEARGTDPFTAFLDHQQRLIVLMATGGMLTSLTGATGIGQGATDAHEETWRTIVRRDAAAVATALNRTVTDTLLDRAFPGRPHLAAFDFETEPAPGPAEVFDLAAKAVQAGYRVTQAELQERTGYALEAAQDAGGVPAFGALPFANRESLIANRAASRDGQTEGAWGKAPPRDDSRFTIHDSPATQVAALAEALQSDCAPLAEALQSLLADPSPEAARALAARLPELLPEDPELASEIQTLLDETFTAESAPDDSRFAIHDSPAATPASNRAPRDYKRDENGKFSKTNHPGTHQREGETKPNKDSLGRLPDDGKPLSVDDNIARGKKAVTRALTHKQDVRDAMFRPESGPIDFIWGTPGEKAKGREGGYGISHAFAKHPEDIAKLPEIIAKGTAYKVKSKGPDGTSDYRGRIAFVHGNGAVFVDPQPKGKALVVTAYRKRDEGGFPAVEKNPKA